MLLCLYTSLYIDYIVYTLITLHWYGIMAHAHSDCIMPQRFCGNECNQRRSVTRNTFTSNNYTYGGSYFSCISILLKYNGPILSPIKAAHIVLLGLVNFEECTAINVCIISCWDLTKTSICKPANTTISIPTCVNCPAFQVQVGKEYLIAGHHRKVQGVRRMLLPSYRRYGLFTEWDDERHSDLFG